MIQKILRSTNPKLRLKSKKVNKIDKKVLGLIADLKDTLKIQKNPEGVGLAAPQIGKNLQVFLASYRNFERVVINPEIVAIDKRLSDKKKVRNEILEGCLSLPNYYGPLRRARSVTIKYMDEMGTEKTEKFDDFNAQIILHEIDHLNGILFVDHLLKEKKTLYKLEKDEWEEVELI
jgi:peptide deformylase